MILSLDQASLEELNDYFGELRTDNSYTEPEPIELGEEHVQKYQKSPSGRCGAPFGK